MITVIIIILPYLQCIEHWHKLSFDPYQVLHKSYCLLLTKKITGSKTWSNLSSRGRAKGQTVDHRKQHCLSIRSPNFHISVSSFSVHSPSCCMKRLKDICPSHDKPKRQQTALCGMVKNTALGPTISGVWYQHHCFPAVELLYLQSWELTWRHGAPRKSKQGENTLDTWYTPSRCYAESERGQEALQGAFWEEWG